MDKAASLLPFILALVITGCGDLAKTSRPSGASPSALSAQGNTCVSASCGSAVDSSLGTDNSSTEGNATIVDGLRYPYTTTGILSAISDAGTGGTIIVAPSAVISVTSTISLLTGQTLLCYQGVTFNLNVPAADSFQLIGVSDVRISGCTFTWETGSTDAIAVRNTVSRVRIENNTFINFPGTGAAAIVFVGDRSNLTQRTQVTNITVSNNRFIDFTGSAVNIQDYASSIAVVGNTFTSGVSPTNLVSVNAQTTDGGTSMSSLTISDNSIWNGTGGDCVQVQRLLGNAITEVVIRRNMCIWLAPGNGFSSAGVEGLVQSGNVVQANGFSQNTAIGNAIFEVANVRRSSETDNAALLGTQSGDSQITIFSVIAGNPGGTTSANSFNGNVAYAWYKGKATVVCWYVAVTAENGNVLHNEITRNTCDFTGSTGKAAGIFVQSGNSTANISYNTIQRNTAIGSNIIGDCGVCIENDAGSMSGNTLGTNEISAFQMPYGSNMGGQVIAPPWPSGVAVDSFFSSDSQPARNEAAGNGH